MVAPSAVTVNASFDGRLSKSRTSSNRSLISEPSAMTSALVSTGGVWSSTLRSASGPSASYE